MRKLTVAVFFLGVLTAVLGAGFYRKFVSANDEQQEHFFRRKVELKNVVVGKTEVVPTNDEQLVKRIVKAYQSAEKEFLGNSMWQHFFDHRHKPLHDIFQSGNITQATQILRNPGTNDHFYGIDMLAASVTPSIVPDVNNKQSALGHASVIFDHLIRFGEAIGAFTLDNSASYNPASYYLTPRSWDVNSVVDKLDGFLGVTLSFPNPYPDEWGTLSSRGVISYRVPQALYQAHLVKTMLKDIPNPKVLEIGAGLGRTAYYARLFGIKDYTIIDIPMTAAASGYFLGRTLGEDQVLLLGEHSDHPENLVKVLTPDQFLNDDQQYDLILNVDSLTEMDTKVSKAYLDKIEKSTPLFVSINHESNPATVNQLLKDRPSVKDHKRNCYWMRTGYCEEIYKF